MTGEVPIEPDAETAREWLVGELAKAPYREAEPTWFDRLSSAVWDWVSSLLEGSEGGPPALVWAILLSVAIAALVASYLIFGPPRLNRRSAAAGAVFDDADTRDADAIRAAAESAAADEDWPLAIEEMFRSIARGLSERAVLVSVPGMTAGALATRAQRFFPDHAVAFASAAARFDRVRYLGGGGSRADFDQVATLEGVVRASTPDFTEPVGS